MNFTEEEWESEKQRLTKTLQQIEIQLEEAEGLRSDKQREVSETRAWMWEEVTKQTQKFDAAVDIVQHSLELERQDKIYSLYQEKYNSLFKMKESPYFGRFDFIEEGEPKEEMLYIGIHTLEDETGDILVYDWRAPISSIYYDFQLGAAYYRVEDERESRTFHGEVSLKRQYKIEHGQLQYMFDSAVQIGDQFLQELLSQKRDQKMKSIVTSIQKEQNQVIRDKEHKVVIVQGVAGSGKTSIALQRVAFLLYTHRQSISSNNILIFSPNEIFNDYIANVLPELGEQNTPQTTFQAFVKRYLDLPLVIESKYDQMEHLLTLAKAGERESRRQGIQYKSSLQFMQLLKAYMDYLQREGLIFEDIRFQDQLVVSKEQLREWFFVEYKNMSLEHRLDKLRSLILQRVKEMQEEMRLKVFQRLKKSNKYLGSNEELQQMSKAYVKKKWKRLKRELRRWSFDLAFQAYLQLFEQPEMILTIGKQSELPADWPKICQYSLDSMKKGDLLFEDVSPLLYFIFMFAGNPTVSTIHHLVIDEYQDYPAIFYEIMKKIFPRSKFTILGDINQSINPYASLHNVEVVSQIFGGNSSSYTLRKSYRSTKEIVHFSREILRLDNEQIEAVSREGEKPALIQTSPVKKKERVLQLIAELQQQEMKSIAIICKNAQESEQAYYLLKDEVALHYVSVENQILQQGIVLLPSYLSKGLEFDAVIVWEVSSEVYPGEEVCRLLYTVCTRALHSLNLFYTEQSSPLITRMNSVLYRHMLQ